MILQFAEQCSVRFHDPSEKFISYLTSEQLIRHEIHESIIDIEVYFKKQIDYKIESYLHPDAVKVSQGLGIYDEKKNILIIHKTQKENLFLIDVNYSINPAFLFEKIFDLVKLKLLQKRVVTLHSAAFRINGKTVLLGGWDGVGKSSVLVDLMSNDGKYIGDDRIFLDTSGNVYPIFRSIKLFYHEIENYPEYLSNIKWFKRFSILFSQWLDSIMKNSISRALKNISKILLKVQRKLKINYVVIDMRSKQVVENVGLKIDKFILLERGEKPLISNVNDHDILSKQIAVNTLYADLSLIRLFLIAEYLYPDNSIFNIEYLKNEISRIAFEGLKNVNIEFIKVDGPTKISL